MEGGRKKGKRERKGGRKGREGNDLTHPLSQIPGNTTAYQRGPLRRHTRPNITDVAQLKFRHCPLV